MKIQLLVCMSLTLSISSAIDCMQKETTPASAGKPPSKKLRTTTPSDQIDMDFYSFNQIKAKIRRFKPKTPVEERFKDIFIHMSTTH